jgi:hypothetical protein
MLDQLLGWAVIWLPIALSVAFIFVPARSEDARQHMRWRYWLAAVAVILGALSWWQQSRAIRVSNTDRENAIKETSKQVSADVTKAVTSQYAQMIGDQKAQISQLQNQLAAQSKDVSTIKGSNIVTGKNPIKVEVTNEPSVPTGPMQVENIRLFWEQESSTHADAPYAKKVTIQADTPINPIKLAIICDTALKYGEGGADGKGIMFFGGNEIYKDDAKIFIVNMTTQGQAALRPDAPLVFHLYSDKPINIVKFERGPR